MKLKRFLVKVLGMQGKAHNEYEKRLDTEYKVIEQ